MKLFVIKSRLTYQSSSWDQLTIDKVFTILTVLGISQSQSFAFPCPKCVFSENGPNLESTTKSIKISIVWQSILNRCQITFPMRQQSHQSHRAYSFLPNSSSKFQQHPEAPFWQSTSDAHTNMHQKIHTRTNKGNQENRVQMKKIKWTSEGYISCFDQRA